VTTKTKTYLLPRLPRLCGESFECDTLRFFIPVRCLLSPPPTLVLPFLPLRFDLATLIQDLSSDRLAFDAIVPEKCPSYLLPLNRLHSSRLAGRDQVLLIWLRKIDTPGASIFTSIVMHQELSGLNTAIRGLHAREGGLLYNTYT
jgi:hypothetical protein